MSLVLSAEYYTVPLKRQSFTTIQKYKDTRLFALKSMIKTKHNSRVCRCVHFREYGEVQYPLNQFLANWHKLSQLSYVHNVLNKCNRYTKSITNSRIKLLHFIVYLHKIDKQRIVCSHWQAWKNSLVIGKLPSVILHLIAVRHRINAQEVHKRLNPQEITFHIFSAVTVFFHQWHLSFSL